MAYLVLDIETIRDESLPALDDPEEFPPPPYHAVVTIAGAWLNEALMPQRVGVIGSGDEREVLTAWANLVNARQPVLVTWNGRGFDLPVLAMRCMKHGVSLAGYFDRPAYRTRYKTTHHIDLKDQLADNGATRSAKLDVVAKMLGLSGKGDVCGGDVGELWAAGEQARVREYNLDDVAQTAKVFLHWCRLTGKLVEDPASRMRAIDELVHAQALAEAAQ